MRTFGWLLVLGSVVLGCRDESGGPASPLQRNAAIIPAGLTEVTVAPILIARDINDQGVVVGPLTPFPNSRAGVRYPDGRVINLGVLPGDHWSDASAVNNVGQVVGRSGNNTTGVIRAFIWDAERGMRWLGTLGGGVDQPASINDRGVVVGTSQLTAGSVYPTTAFLWQSNAGMTDLGALIGDRAGSGAFDINARGQVVGTSVRGPFLWQRDLSTTFLPFPQGASAEGINAQGAIVGSYFNASLGKNQAYRWSLATGFVTLSPASADHGASTAISDDGTVVGIVISGGVVRAFVFRDVFDSALGFSGAEGVNNCGVASGFTSSVGAIWVPSGVPLTGICPR